MTGTGDEPDSPLYLKGGPLPPQGERVETILPADGTMPRVEYVGGVPKKSDAEESIYGDVVAGGVYAQPQESSQQSAGGDLSVDHSESASMGIPSEAPLSVPGQVPGTEETKSPADAFKPLGDEKAPESLITPEREAQIRARAQLAVELARGAYKQANIAPDKIDALAGAIYADLAKQ